MDKRKFLKNGFLGLSAVAVMPSVVSSCSKDEKEAEQLSTDSQNCQVSPVEMVGPFPIKTPAQLAQSNIIGDRTGVPLLIKIKVQDQSSGCVPLANVLVDIWQCDKDGNYSQYGGNQLQAVNYTTQNFLRGRQTTDLNGEASFISIFPGWYPGRAPHIHVEVLTASGTSLLVTQIAFPVAAYSTVYASNGYNGTPDRSNTQDSLFSDSLAQNMADNVTGNLNDGYTLSKIITVS
ncbi:protocatechuate 3,4-dioxygenase beta subunit [Flavobacterium sp. 90]|uniref:dioxygenase family protein n=1 Tax=unclassified Flavobacterium TaxID=196869 RepID=UPI000EB2FD0F|nr:MULTISPECIES: intradiol ring-cleavage dioxygenase [unclassified Flavobacterium]RKR04594.1 protocatechuate 3,4-dioxygenase beta subunit [Flavobacterium sp. 81]TCK55921.1 protocatechuate 3,4-dioxygenase beta subunit [Flavobacterium sp. 90]